MRKFHSTIIEKSFDLSVFPAHLVSRFLHHIQFFSSTSDLFCQCFSVVSIIDLLCTWGPSPGMQYQPPLVGMHRNNSDNRAILNVCPFSGNCPRPVNQKALYCSFFCPPFHLQPTLSETTVFSSGLINPWLKKQIFFYVIDVLRINLELCMTGINKKTNCKCFGCHSRDSYHAISFLVPKCVNCLKDQGNWKACIYLGFLRY